MDQKYQRFPAVQRSINNINVETDIRVRIIGRIADKLPDGIVLQDLEGAQAEVRFDRPIYHDAGAFVRIFARVLPLENGFELSGELIQPVNNLDMELHRKVFSY
ncbi:MAG: hypothetical protein HYW25_06010 [Candidatus Aenigmarchaeota archaeon]|nr:hypothetical protein [Candidatus Aenigmarchaeota archaeon]